MSTLIGYTPEERNAFVRNAGILAELVVLKVPLVRLAARHGIPRDDLIRELRGHLGMGLAALEADVDGACLVDAPPALEPAPVAMRKQPNSPRHPGPRKPAA